MTTIPAERFLSWAATQRIVPDARFPHPRCLVYEQDGGHSRFWVQPGQGEGLRRFLAHLLSGMGPWSGCYVWPRGGTWRNPSPPRSRIEDERALTRYGGRIPSGSKGACVYPSAEAGQLLNLMEIWCRSAFSVLDDLFVVPDHGEVCVHTDHHDVVHVSCAHGRRMEQFIRHMAAGGYKLPEELPDPTFKRPGWMKRG